MKEKLKAVLPDSARRQIRKFSVKFLRAVLRVSGDFLDFTAKNGFELERELPASLAGILQQPNRISPFGAKDFLLLAAPQAIQKLEIVASIVIPVFNKADYTFQCLRALIREVDLTRTEIIVVDNASNDETQQMLTHLTNFVRVIRNETNKGFVEACNQGAAAATGRFLVFLNNDTIVQPKWLDYLIETAEQDEKIGAVGSMLIFPNGRIQEAGGIVWNDGNAHNYGRGEHPADLRFNFAREVDYCSGASLLIKKSLFERLGGFDLRFAPAYYEDTDLCLGVRAANFKVIFQPLSKVIHYEGVTAGLNANSGFKRFQEINRHKFVEKWQAVLERDNLPRNEKNVLPASNRKCGLKIAVFEIRVPHPDQDSGSVRLAAILQTLSQLGQVTIFPLDNQPENRLYQEQVGKIGVEIVAVEDFPHRFKQQNFDVAILSRPEAANSVLSQVRRLSPATKIVYDTVDVHFVRLNREFELTKDKRFVAEAAKFKEIEMTLALAADKVWCVTNDDKNFLQTVVPNAKIEVVPNIHALYGRGKSFSEREGLLFIGNFLHRPNVDAFFYFVNEILPTVLEKLPHLRFHAVGVGMSPDVFALNSENVRIEGFVPNVAPLFENCRVFVAPLRFGAGMKGKVGQALAFGLPAVTTRIGAEGMNLNHENEILLADDAANFAHEILRVYQNESLWQCLSDNGFRFIKENLSPAAVEEKITSSLKELLRKENLEKIR